MKLLLMKRSKNNRENMQKEKLEHNDFKKISKHKMKEPIFPDPKPS